MPLVLSGAPLIDGRVDEWDPNARNVVRSTRARAGWPADPHRRRTSAGCSRAAGARRQAGFRRPELAPLDPRRSATASGSASTTTRRPAALFFGSTGPGAVRARRIETREYGREEAVEEPRIAARLAARATDGYVLEMRMPLSLVGQPSACSSTTATSAAPRARATARSMSRTCAPRAGSIAASPDLADHLRQFSQPGVELTVASADGRRAHAARRAGAARRLHALRGFLPRIYRLFLDGGAIPRSVSQAERERAASELTQRASRGKPETALFAGPYENSVIVAAAAPIFTADGKRVIGVIQLAQTADRWLTLRDRALTRLLNLTLFVTLFAVRGGVLVRRPHDAAHHPAAAPRAKPR